MKHFWTLTIPCAGLIAVVGPALGPSLALAQDAPRLNARELFYSPPPSPPAGGNAAGAAAGAATGKVATTAAAGKSGAAAVTSATATTGAGKSGSTVAGSGKSSGSANTSAGAASAYATSTGATSNGGTSNATAASTSTSTKDAAAQNASNDTGKDNPTIVAAVGQGGNLVNTSSSSSAPANGPLGLRYAVLKRESGSAFREVDPETKFRTGDSIRLNVTPSTSGYLYVVQQGASGIWTLLFPRPEVAGGSNFVERGQMLAVPSDKAMWTFDAHAGEEKLFIVLARRPEPDLDKLIYSIDRAGDRTGDRPGDTSASQKLVAQAKVRDDVVNRLRDQMVSRDLVFEKVDESTSDSTGKAENAAYVVSQNPSPDARLVKDLTLSHQ